MYDLITERNHSTDEEIESDELRVCRNIEMPEGMLNEVYIGPCGVFVISRTRNAPGPLYHALREALGTPHVRLLMSDDGFYDAYTNALEPIPEDLDLDEAILEWTQERRRVLDEDALSFMERRLWEINARTKGQYVDAYGTIHQLKGGKFVPTSAVDPDVLYWLTLLGSPLGLHRMYMGKFFSGLAYLITCGIFGVGWLLDAISLLAGFQRDKQKIIIRTPSHRLRKLLGLPIGLAVSVISLFFYLQLLKFTSLAISVGLDAALNDPGVSNSLARLLQTVLSMQ